MNRPRKNSAERPMSVGEITKRAEEFNFDPDIPLRLWLRTAQALLREVSVIFSCPTETLSEAADLRRLGAYLRG
jgi:hypothetical protein